MKSFYITKQRFVNKVIFRWVKRDFNYNAGHLNILNFAYRTILFWNIKNGEQISKQNQTKSIMLTHPKLF